MQLLVSVVVAAVWLIHSAQATIDFQSSPRLSEDRILQGFGVVGDGDGNSSLGGGGDGFGTGSGGTIPTTAAGPVLPPIFAPMPVPITKPIAAPTSVNQPTFVAPVRAPVAIVPVRAPVRVPVPLSFGSTGGGSVPNNDGVTLPSEVPSTFPSTTGGTELDIPTALPTTGSGIVIVDEMTDAPSRSPIIMTPHMNPTHQTWLSFVVTYTSELYTIVKDTANVQDVLRTVHSDIRTSLHHLIKQQNVSSIYIELLESELTGTCLTSVNITNIDALVFPNFPICSDVKAHIVTKIDSSKISEETVRTSFINYVSDSFIPSYNSNSTIARLRYMAPINVSGTLNITLIGVQTTMTVDESKIFVETVQTVLLGLFLNGTQSDRITPMNLEIVELLHQRANNTKNHRSLQTTVSDKEVDIDEHDFDGRPTNKVEVMITTSCTRDKTCTDDALQLFLNEFAPMYGIPLLTALVADPNFYFDDLKHVIIGQYVIPVLPPSKEQSQQTSVDENASNSEKMPTWIIGLIVVMCVIFITTILYIIVRRKVRKMQGDKLRDGLHKENINDEEEKNMLRSTPFTPASAPSHQQIQEWSTGGATYQQPPQSSRDTSIFHKRGKGQPQQQPIHEYEEEDDAYYNDDQRYDNDQFSVEAGNFGETAYDEHQWNSSFRSYT